MGKQLAAIQQWLQRKGAAKSSFMVGCQRQGWHRAQTISSDMAGQLSEPNAPPSNSTERDKKKVLIHLDSYGSHTKLYLTARRSNFVLLRMNYTGWRGFNTTLCRPRCPRFICSIMLRATSAAS